jgi:hypothetical protein
MNKGQLITLATEWASRETVFLKHTPVPSFESET